MALRAACSEIQIKGNTFYHTDTQKMKEVNKRTRHYNIHFKGALLNITDLGLQQEVLGPLPLWKCY